MKIPTNWRELKMDLIQNEHGTFMASVEAIGDQTYKAHRYGGNDSKTYKIEVGEQIVGIKGKSFEQKNNTWKSLIFILKKWLD